MIAVHLPLDAWDLTMYPHAILTNVWYSESSCTCMLGRVTVNIYFRLSALLPLPVQYFDRGISCREVVRPSSIATLHNHESFSHVSRSHPPSGDPFQKFRCKVINKLTIWLISLFASSPPSPLVVFYFLCCSLCHHWLKHLPQKHRLRMAFSSAKR